MQDDSSNGFVQTIYNDVAPDDASAATRTIVSDSVDVKGWDSVTFMVSQSKLAANIDWTTALFTAFIVQHSDDGSVWTDSTDPRDVANGNYTLLSNGKTVVWSYASNATGVAPSAASGITFQFAYVGPKRYVRLIAVLTGDFVAGASPGSITMMTRQSAARYSDANQQIEYV